MKWLKENWHWLLLWLLCAVFGGLIGYTIVDYWVTKLGW
jgi:hypothetical protein